MQTSKPSSVAPLPPGVTHVCRTQAGTLPPRHPLPSLWFFLRRVRSDMFYPEAPLPVHILPAGPDFFHPSFSIKTLLMGWLSLICLHCIVLERTAILHHTQHLMAFVNCFRLDFIWQINDKFPEGRALFHGSDTMLPGVW